MEAQLKSLAAGGVLGNFIGMLTDSRSFLSYTRHEYFRRILCGLLGRWVEEGQFPDDRPPVGAAGGRHLLPQQRCLLRLRALSLTGAETI